MSNRRFHEIDLLRGVACLAVVAYHYLYRGQSAGWIATHAHPGIEAVARHGYLGVHLFFIISGFVIFMSAQGSSLRGFAASRVARLYPALWVAAPLTAIIVWALNSPHFSVQALQLAVNMTMLAHWFKVEFVDGAYWSLAVEVQFYLLIAVAVALKWMDRAEWWVAAWLAIAAVNALRPMYPLEFWLAAKWAPLFCAGICFYLLSTRGRSPLRLVLIAVSYLLALVYEVGPNLRSSQAAPDLVSAWVGGAAITAFYALFFWIAGGQRQFKPSSLSVWAGLMTYPVYLLHQNIGYVLLETLAPSGLPFGLRLLFAATTVAVLAWIIVSFVEKPLAPRLRRLLSPPRGKGLNADPRSNAASL
jgi:peptidoglycan/LPS O-acetylase OafA/YrhL